MDKNETRRLHYLRRAVEVQNITLEFSRRGVSQKWVYHNVIYPRFYMSMRTYYSCLGYPAKRELARLLREQEADGKPDGGTPI